MVMYTERQRPVNRPESPHVCAKMQPLLLKDKQEVDCSMRKTLAHKPTCNFEDSELELGPRRQGRASFRLVTRPSVPFAIDRVGPSVGPSAN